jgi:folate-binding protein YgfZ
MEILALHDFHARLGARFTRVNGAEAVSGYADVSREQEAFHANAGIIDLGFRSRLCLTGSDRARFLHGQVTNEVSALRTGEGCYAALITAKGRMQSDLNIYCLPEELLLDFEPGLTAAVSARLEKYIIADDVQIVDVAPHYGLLSVQGPQAAAIVTGLGFTEEQPDKPFSFVKITEKTLGDLYLMNRARLGTSGFDLFIPTGALSTIGEKLLAAAKSIGAVFCGWEAFEIRRIEAGIPRFSADMDESNIPLEAGLENGAISFKKGCYIGQEVISRIRTYSEVAKALRGLRLENDWKSIPIKGDKLFHGEKEVGYITSAVFSSMLNSNIALGYVRKEVNEIGNRLTLRNAEGEGLVRIVELPFKSD